VNDNPPQFETTSIYLNETDNNNNFGTKFSLVNAYDMDDLDDGKLTFKIEDCFYLNKNILIKKPAIASPNTNHLSYPLCSRQFMELIDSDDWMNKKKKSISLKLNLNNFNSLLKNSTDYYLKQNIISEPIINFNIDISVRDSSHYSAFTRVQLNIYLKKQSNPFIQNKVIVNKNKQLVREENLTYGFRKATYFIQIKSSEQLKKQVEFIRLQNEYVWMISSSSSSSLNGTNSLANKQNLFKPFDLNFSIINNNNELIKLEPNFGSLYFDIKKLDQIKDFVFRIKIGCKCPYSDRIDDSSEDLFKTTQIIISIENSAIYNMNTIKDLIYYPIWSQIKLNASIDENLPAGSWLYDGLNGKKFTAKTYLNNQVLEKIQNLLPF